MKRLLVTAAIALVSMGTIIGCGGKQAASSGNAVKITATYRHYGGIVSETIVGKAWEELMEQKLGVDLDITWNFIPTAEYTEKLNIILASNDLTDLIFVTRSVAAPYESQGLFEDISKHWNNLPLYQEFVKGVPYGKDKITNGDGSIPGFFNGENPRQVNNGLAIIYPMAIRYDSFQQLGIKPPETTDELLDAARKLKAAFPDKYPVSWGSQYLTYTYKTANGIFWDGSKYIYGPMTDNYRAMLTFLNKLYAEKLLDPESMTDNNEAKAQKALNGSTFITLGIWFNTIDQWNDNAESNAVWANIANVTDTSFGPGWWGIYNENERTIADAGEATYIKAGAKNMDILLKLCDLQYDPETIRLITWGIEGITYTLKPDGNPTFVEKFHQSSNFWQVGDEYGIRASTKFRPGLQGPYDTLSFIDCAPNQNAIVDGEFVQIPYELAYQNDKWPDSPKIPTDLFHPPIQFTPEENNANAAITTVVQTYVEEQRAKFITGEVSLNTWDAYVNQIRNMNIQQVLDMRNEKAAAFK